MAYIRAGVSQKVAEKLDKCHGIGASKRRDQALDGGIDLGSQCARVLDDGHGVEPCKAQNVQDCGVSGSDLGERAKVGDLDKGLGSSL